MKNTLTNVILSIKPIYAEAIMAGTKKVEFRKKIFKREVEKIFIYSSMPKKMIIGYFTILEVIEDTPSNIWKEFKEVGGISEKDFFEYYKNTEKGFSIKIDKVVKFKEEIEPEEFIEEFCAPQSYIYIEQKTTANSRLARLGV
ncbi:MAG: ASCH domain-containing protein [Flavobacterium sp.]